MPYHLTRKIVFATGAARGLGKAIAARFLAEGCRVLAFDQHAANLQTAVAEWDAGERVLARVGDVRSRSDIQAALEAALGGDEEVEEELRELKSKLGRGQGASPEV